VAQLRLSATRTAPRRVRGNDAGLVLVGALVKFLLVVGIVGVIGYDSLSILTTQYSVRDDASAAAIAGHDALANAMGRQSAAYAAVLAYAKDHGDVVVSQGPSNTSGRRYSWTVELRRDAHTIIASRLPRVKQYVVATASASASDPVS
jgi:hypothetical protein